MSYTIAIFVHVLAGTVLLGGSYFAWFTRRAIRGAADQSALLGWLDFERRSAHANPVAAMVLLGTGLYLGSVGWWSEAWFYVAVATFVVNGAWAARTCTAAATRAAQAAVAAGPGPVSAETDRLRRSRTWDVAGDVLAANDLATLYLMIAKPSLWGALAIVLTANAALLALRAWSWRGVEAPIALRRPGAVAASGAVDDA